MRVVVIGMNHKTAPLALRERLALSDARIRELLSEDVPGPGPQPEERVLLSTCNRVEVYMALPDAMDPWAVFTRLAHSIDTLADVDVAAHTYTYEDGEAARHLFRVASGLDSMILGESQILGQVAHAYALAQEVHAVGPYLSRLFQMAVHVGKRARSETDISRAHVSVGSAAVHLAQAHHPHLHEARVAVLGAGQMGRLVARYLHAQGVKDIRVVNRTFARAQALAAEVEGQAHPWDALPRLLGEVDVIFVTTGAAEPLITREEIARARRAGASPLLIVDISVPRNVAADVDTLPHVRVFDIDALKGMVAEGMDVRRQAIPQVERIIDDAVAEYERWLQARAVAPTISALYRQAESLRQSVLRRTLRRYSDRALDSDVVDEVTRILVEKLVQIPARNLQAMARNGGVNGYDKVLRELFELET